MKHKYFGILTEEMNNTWSDEEILILLNKNRLIESYILPTFIEERKTDKKNGFERVIRLYLKDRTNRFSSHLIKEVYPFLKLFMDSSFEINSLMFKKNFEINNFGISEKKQKKSALKIFKENFFSLVKKEQIGLDRNANEEIGAEKIFKSLKRVQYGLIEKLKQEETILHCYLFGYTDYFNRELLDTHPLLLEIYEFENKLNIIIELNKKFQFEKDDFFTPKSIAQKIYEDYPKDFDSLTQLQFIEQQILNSKKVNRAYIFSVFYFFKKELSINTPTAKLFGEIINSYFNFDFGELKDNSSNNLEHDKRIEKLKKDWNNFQ